MKTTLFDSDWSQLLWRTGMVGWPAVAICLFVGVHDGHRLQAVVAAGGAFTVGLGTMQRFTRFSLAPMLLACVGMMASAWAGSMLGGSTVALLLASAAWAAVTGIASLLGPGATWISLQWSIALFIAGGFPGAAQAFDRALLVGAGGLIQIALLGSLILVFPALRPPDVSKKSIATTRPVALATALRASMSSVLASVAVMTLSLRNGYWAPMTALSVLKPSLHDEFHSVLQRCLGTIVGATVASGFVYLSRANPQALMTMTCVLAACTYSLQRVNYFFFSLALTAFIVFLLSIARPQELDLLIHRITATVLGCAASLLVDAVLKQFGLDANRQSKAPDPEPQPSR